MHFSQAPVAIIWDGLRHVVALWTRNGAKPARFLAAEMPGGVELIAAADAGDDGPDALIGMLPAGCRIVHVVTLTESGVLDVVPVQLDDRLTTDRVDAGLDGLALLHLHASEGDGAARPGLSVERVSTPSTPSKTVVGLGLNRVGIGSDGSRLVLAGPFLHPDDDRLAGGRVTGAIGAAGDGLVLDFAGDDQAAADVAGSVLVAHLSEAMRHARQALATIDAELRLAVEAELDGLLVAPELSEVDASGLSQVAAFRRGFRLLRAKAGESRIAMPEWRDGDEVLLLAQPGRNLVWTGDGEAVSGAPIMVRAEAGQLRAVSLREAYTPSASTGLTIGARSSGALVASGASRPAVPLDDGALAASRLAMSLLETTAPASEATILTGTIVAWSAAVAAAPAAGPLAGLDAVMRRRHRAGGLLAGLAETAAIDPSRLEELAERNLDEQIAMLLWAISVPRLAALACGARLLLPLPGGGRGQNELEALLAWYEDPALPQRLSRGAMALAGQDRKAARLLHDMAGCVHQSWVDDGAADETGRVLDAVRGVAAQSVSKLEGLLADLRRQAPRQTQQAPALEVLGRMRSELQEAALETGVPDGFVEELGTRLAGLSPAEILLLHQHFAGLRREAARSAAATVLLERWEAEAGCAGLAMRAGRSGDALVGAARLAASTAGLAGTLCRIELLAPALAGLDAAIDTALGADDRASPQAAWLRAALGGYGRLLLLHRAMAQADDVFASVPSAHAAPSDGADPGFRAAYRRLRAGTGETLGRYLVAAGLVSGRDHDWGAADAALRPAASG